MFIDILKLKKIYFISIRKVTNTFQNNYQMLPKSLFVVILRSVFYTFLIFKKNYLSNIRKAKNIC